MIWDMAARIAETNNNTGEYQTSYSYHSTVIIMTHCGGRTLGKSKQHNRAERLIKRNYICSGVALCGRFTPFLHPVLPI